MQDRTHTTTDNARVSGRLDNSTSGQLAHLSEMHDYEISDGEPDIKGWDVRTMTGEKVGKVEDLIVDTALMKVRYIEVKFDKLLMASGEMRHALIPIGSSRLDDDADDVLVNLRDEQLIALPAYVRGTLTREYELELLHGFERADASSPTLIGAASDFYDDEHFNESRAFQGRRSAEHSGESYLRRHDH